jgi:hypothetical protein
MNIERKYIINENNQRIAVQLDIDTFERIENILENYALAQLMDEDTEGEATLDHDKAIEFYKTLEKGQ